MRRHVSHTLLLALAGGSIVLAPPAGAEVPEYTLQDQKDKQEPLLQICRADLELGVF